MDPTSPSWILALERHRKLLPKAVLILLLGISGVGKTSFISKAIKQDLQLGRQLKSATSEIIPYFFERNGYNIILFDTPGFDDTHNADVDILRDIVVLLRYMNDHNARISGIIYLHRITDNRVSGSTGNNFQMLRKLCGEGFLRHVVLVTTMWEVLNTYEGDQRQEQLEKYFWGDMIAAGAVALKYMGETESALSIIDILLERRLSQDTIPDIQRESLEEKRQLLETSAGRVIFEDIKLQLQQYDRSIAKVQEEYMELEQEMKSGFVYTLREKEEEIRELKREEDRLIDRRKRLEGFLQGRDAEGSSIPFLTRGGHSRGQETETASETRPTLWMGESALQRRSRNERPRNAPNREDTYGPESEEQNISIKDDLQPQEMQSVDVRHKGSFPEAEMAFHQTIDYRHNAEGLISLGTRAYEREKVKDNMPGIGEIGFQEENYSKRTNYEPTPIHQAVYNGDETAVRLLVENGADVNAKDGNGGTALFWAVENGHERMVFLLLEIGADVNAKAGNAMTALHQASRSGYEKKVQLLLDWRADVTAKNDSGETALHWAVENRQEAVVRLLLERGADINAETASGETALHWAIESEDDDIAQLLVGQGANINTRASMRVTALHWAVENRQEAVVRLLLERGADVNAKTDNGMTALHQAGRNGYEEVALLLVRVGADVSARTDRGQTALHWAAENGEESVTRLLLSEKGTDINAMDGDGRTSLHRAAGRGKESLVWLLLERGADLNVSNMKGRTALYEAAKNGHQAVVRLLLERGANLDVSDMNGRTALHEATKNGHQAVVRLLEEKGMLR